MATSLFERKRDLVYLVFFIVHLPVMLGTFVEPSVYAAAASIARGLFSVRRAELS